MSTNNVNMACPCCGSQKTHMATKADSIEIPYANPATVETRLLICTECGMETDITESNDLKEKINAEISKSIGNMIDALAFNNKWTYSSIEHALDLPERTLSRWKNKPNLSKGNVTLLRILNTFPWIVEVADNNYRTNFANKKVVQASAKIIGSMIGPAGYSCKEWTAQVSEGESSIRIGVAATFERNAIEIPRVECNSVESINGSEFALTA